MLASARPIVPQLNAKIECCIPSARAATAAFAEATTDDTLSAVLAAPYREQKAPDVGRNFKIVSYSR